MTGCFSVSSLVMSYCLSSEESYLSVNLGKSSLLLLASSDLFPSFTLSGGLDVLFEFLELLDWARYSSRKLRSAL